MGPLCLWQCLDILPSRKTLLVFLKVITQYIFFHWMFDSGNLFMLDYWRHALGKWFISPFIIFKGSKWIKPRPYLSSDCFTLEETSNFCFQFLWKQFDQIHQAWNYSETSAQFLVLKHNAWAHEPFINNYQSKGN